MPLSSHMTCTAQIRPVAAGGAAFPPQAGRRLPPALVLYCNYQRNNHSPARPPSPLMAGFPVTMQRPAQAAVEQSNVTRQRVLVKSVGVMQPRETGRPAIRGGCKGETGAAGNRERGGRQRKQKRRWGGRGGRASVEPGTLPPKPQPAIAGGQTKKAAIRAYHTWPLPTVTGQYNRPASCAQQRYSGGCGGTAIASGCGERVQATRWALHRPPPPEAHTHVAASLRCLLLLLLLLLFRLVLRCRRRLLLCRVRLPLPARRREPGGKVGGQAQW